MKKIAFGMVSLISCIFLNFNFVDTYAYAETSVVTENITITEPELAPLVEDPEVIALESISLDQPTLSLTVGTNTQLTLGYSPADTTADRTAVWTSSNSGVAIVDATGNVTAIGVGIATLTATVGDKTAASEVTITEPEQLVEEPQPPVEEPQPLIEEPQPIIEEPLVIVLEAISIDQPLLNLTVGTSGQLTLGYSPADTTADRNAVWTSSDSSIATVDATGNVTAIGSGTAIITADVGDKTVASEVTVTEPEPAPLPVEPETIALESVSIDQPLLNLTVGTNAQLTVEYSPADTSSDRNVIWSSSDSGVAVVDAMGNVTAIGVGIATITASVGNKTAASEVKVTEEASIQANVTESGSTAKLLFTFDDGAKETINIAAPVLAEKGFEGTAFVGENIETQYWASSGMMDEADLEELYSTYGWDLGNHSASHKWLGNRTDAATILAFQQDYLKNQNWLLANGWTRGAYHVAYTGGSHNAELIESLKAIGVKTARTTIYDLETIPIEDYYRLKTINVLYGLAYVKEQIDEAVSTGSTIILMFHGINETASQYVISTADFQAIVDYASQYSDQGSLSVMTVSDWYSSVAGPEESIPLESISLDQTAVTLTTGANKNLVVSYNPTNTTDDKTVSWSSSNTAVATVDAAGKVTAISKGTATITANVGGKTATSQVTVPEVTSLIGQLMFTFDDGAGEDLTIAAPILAEKGFVGTAYVGQNIEAQYWSAIGKMDEADLEELYSTYGWDLANHSADHKWLGNRTDAATILTFQQDYLANQNWLLANGWTRGAYQVAYSGGSYNDQLIESLKAIGVETARTSQYGLITNPISDYYKLKTINVLYGLDYVKRQIDEAVRTGSSVLLMIHGINETSAQYVISTADFQAIVDYAAQYSNQGSLNVTTVSEWYHTLAGPADPIPLESISLDQTAFDLTTGASKNLVVSYNPTNTTDNKTVSWSSSNTAVATVDAAGKVTAISKGTATITANVGGKTATSQVTVPEVTSLIGQLMFTFDDGAGEDLTIAAPILAEKGFVGTAYVGQNIEAQYWSAIGKMDEADLEELYSTYGWDLANHSADHKWLGNRTDAATILTFQQDYLANQNWLLANGWTRGAYQVAYSGGSYNDQLIESLKAIGVETARTSQYGLITNPISDYYKLKTINVLYGLDYVKRQIDEAVRTGSSVLLMIHGINETAAQYVISTADFQAIVDYAAQYSNQGSLNVTTVSEWYHTLAGPADPIPLESISLDQTAFDLTTGASKNLVVSYNPTNTTDNKTISWSSSNTEVATVDAAGKVTAISGGSATITASVGGKTATSEVTVEEGIWLPPTMIMFDDGSESVYTEAFPALTARGIAGSFFVVTDSIGTDGYVTWEQLEEMQAAGWTIGNHTNNHIDLVESSRSDAIAAVADGAEALSDRGFNGSTYLAAPYNSMDDRVESYIADLVTLIRIGGDSDGISENILASDNNKLRARSILRGDSPEEVFVNDYAYNIERDWAVCLNFHNLGYSDDDDYFYTMENFETLLDMLIEDGASFYTVDQYVNEYVEVP